MHKENTKAKNTGDNSNDFIADVSSSTEFKVWDELFGILAWKYILTKSGDMYLDGEEVYNELKNKFELKRK
jgi:hypothetical protein